MAISSRPILGRGISGDPEDPDVLPGSFSRSWKGRVKRDRYPGIDAEAPLDPAEEAKPRPIYDALPPDQKAAVDRLVVGYRMVNMRGTE